jgi:hypothetical protein
MDVPLSSFTQKDLRQQFGQVLDQAGKVIVWRAAAVSVALLGPVFLIAVAYTNDDWLPRVTPTWTVLLIGTTAGAFKAYADLKRRIDAFWSCVEQISEARIAIWINLDRFEDGPRTTTQRLNIAAANETRLDDRAKPLPSEVINWRRQKRIGRK